MTRQRQIGWVAAGVALVLLLGGVGVAFAVADQRRARPVAVLVEPSPSPATPSASPSPPAGSDITGPLDLLIIGVDTRVSVPGWQPHADAIMVLHVPAGLDSGYLFSLPRDLLVTVPAFPKAGFRGGRMKITEAMARGSRVPGSRRVDVRQGFDLLSKTVSAYTGIKDFDGGAVLTFTGLSRLTDALGGVTLKIDQKVVSKHIRPDGTRRTLQAGGGGYVGPQATYLPGTRHLKGWQALDYARQRYTAGGDYTRQRHQRQLITALLSKAMTAGLATDAKKLAAVLKALGDTLVFSGDRTPLEYAYALRRLRPAALTLVGLPGSAVGSGTAYRGEQLQQTGRSFLKALVAGNADRYLDDHPDLVNKP